MSETTTLYSAEETLDRMAEIVRAEMMGNRVYVSGVVRPDLAEKGAICGGRRHCAIGALWVAHGVPYTDYMSDEVALPAVAQSERMGFMATDAELALAHDALGEAADAFAESIGMASLNLGDCYGDGVLYAYAPSDDPERYTYQSVSKIEALFEGIHRLTKDELLGVVRDARERVAAKRASS